MARQTKEEKRVGFDKADKVDGETKEEWQARLNKEDAQRKASKSKIKVVKEYDEQAYDTRGKPKVQTVTLYSNGLKYRTLKGMGRIEDFKDKNL